MNATIESLLVPDSVVEPYIPQIPEIERIRNCVILGSFKYHDEIVRAALKFEENGIHVLAPEISSVEGSIGEFKLLASDNKLREQLQKEFPHLTDRMFAAFLEHRFMRTIDQAGFIYIVAPGGYGGDTVSAEIGWAKHAKKPIYSSEPTDPSLDENDGVVWPPFWTATAEGIKAYTVGDVAAMVKRGKLDEEDYPWCEGYVWKWPRPEINRK